MGFGKIKKEVEASGLDPQVAHADLTVDGRLVAIPTQATVVAYYEPEKLQEIIATYPQVDGLPEVVYEQIIEVKTEEEKEAVKTKENEEDVLDAFKEKLNSENAAVEPSETAKLILDAANKGIEEAVQDLRNKGIPVYGMDEDGNIVTEEEILDKKQQEVVSVEPEKVVEPVEEKKALTKKKPTKK